MRSIYKSSKTAFASVDKYHRIIGNRKRWKLFFILNNLIIYQNLPYKIDRVIEVKDFTKILTNSGYNRGRIIKLIDDMRQDRFDDFNFEDQIKAALVLEKNRRFLSSMYDYEFTGLSIRRSAMILLDLIAYKNLRDYCIGGILWKCYLSNSINGIGESDSVIVDEFALTEKSNFLGLSSKIIKTKRRSVVINLFEVESIIITRSNNVFFNEESTVVKIRTEQGVKDLIRE